MSLQLLRIHRLIYLTEIQGHADVYILDIRLSLRAAFVEGKNLVVSQFYAKMANSEELLKTSQP